MKYILEIDRLELRGRYRSEVVAKLVNNCKVVEFHKGDATIVYNRILELSDVLNRYFSEGGTGDLVQVTTQDESTHRIGDRNYHVVSLL